MIIIRYLSWSGVRRLHAVRAKDTARLQSEES